MMNAAALLDRIATTLRTRIGPTVGDDYAKTQTYMASVILGKLAGELRNADQAAVSAAELTRVEALREDAAAAAARGGRARPRYARRTPRRHRARGSVTALYADATALGQTRFEQLLGPIRACLRARLRVLEYAA